MRRFPLAATLVITLLSAVALPARAAPDCGIHWGSLPRSNPLYSGRQVLLDARAGRHRCFERLVVELGPDGPGLHGVTPGFHVGYVPRLRADGSGRPVALKGGAVLQVIVHARAYDQDTGRPTLPVSRAGDVAVPVGGAFRTLRQIKYAGTFEGQTTFGLGVRARLPFRAFRLPGPGNRTRVVVDVAHRWRAAS